MPAGRVGYDITLHEKCPNLKFFLAYIFPVFDLHTDIYSVNLDIQYEYEKIRTRKNNDFRHVSRNVNYRNIVCGDEIKTLTK